MMMHRRANHPPSGSAAPPAAAAAAAAEPTTAPAAAVPGKSTRRRRKTTVRKRNRRLFGARNKEEVLLFKIQALSYAIMAGCGVLLVAKVLFGRDLLSGGVGRRRSPSSAQKNHAPRRSMWAKDEDVRRDFASNAERIAENFSPLEPSEIYTVPDSLPHIGDKSDEYATLRKEYDALQLPDTPQRYTFETVVMQHSNSDQVGYDIYDCPATPPPGYPFDWNIMSIVENWPPDDPEPRSKIFQGLCVFDFAKDYDKAVAYRTKEVPFVMVNDPQAGDAAKRWNAPGYMERMLSDVRHRTEYSENNHFMYWQPPRNNNNKKKKKKKNPRARARQRPDLTPKDWKQPTQMMRMPYKEWLEHANVTDSELGPDKPHWYYRLIGCGETGPQGECDNGSSEYLFDELPFFQPKPSLYMVEYDKQKGIHCRFGMKGVIAENHFDGSRNSIVVLGGERRYILSHPNQCENMALFPNGHPSARHSAVDWSDPNLDEFPQFSDAKGNEVVLQAGDVLYLPTHWFHYIISLSLNFQCNSRSGVDNTYSRPIHECGF